MNCLITSEKLSSYIDAELSAAELLEIERHLPACPRCAERVERLRAVSAKLAGARLPDMPAGAADRLTAVIDANLAARRAAERPPTARRSGARTWLLRLASPAFGGAAAAVAVLAVAVIVWSSGAPLGEQERPSAPVESLQMPFKPSDKGTQSGESAPGADAVTPESRSLSGKSTKLFAPVDEKAAVPPFSADDIRALVEAPLADSYSARDFSDSADSVDPGAAAYLAGPVDPGGLAAARVVGGDRQVDLLFAIRGIYKNREVWVVVVSPAGESEPVTAAAVTLDGELLFRTD